MMQKYERMIFPFKKLIFTVIVNSCFFLLLIVGIQNSSNKSKVNLLIDESISLPVGFIVGSSFISGSLLGSFLTKNYQSKKKLIF